MYGADASINGPTRVDASMLHIIVALCLYCIHHAAFGFSDLQESKLQTYRRTDTQIHGPTCLRHMHTETIHVIITKKWSGIFKGSNSWR